MKATLRPYCAGSLECGRVGLRVELMEIIGVLGLEARSCVTLNSKAMIE